jgi:hypothetical protein
VVDTARLAVWTQKRLRVPGSLQVGILARPAGRGPRVGWCVRAAPDDPPHGGVTPRCRVSAERGWRVGLARSSCCPVQLRVILQYPALKALRLERGPTY